MITYVHRCLIVPAAQQALAQQLCAQLPPSVSGAGMFTTPLSPTGTSPATHYIAAGMIEDQFALLLGNASYLYAACQAHVPPLSVTLAQCQNMLAASDVSTDDPFAALARMGLQMIQAAL